MQHLAQDKYMQHRMTHNEIGCNVDVAHYLLQQLPVLAAASAWLPPLQQLMSAAPAHKSSSCMLLLLNPLQRPCDKLCMTKCVEAQHVMATACYMAALIGNCTMHWPD